MKVYYSEAIGRQQEHHHMGEKAGIKQIVNWHFTYLDREYMIPCIYRFSQGIVVDILQPLDQEEVKGFMEKYKDIDSEELSSFDEKRIERERPYGPVEIRDIRFNGKRGNRGWRSTGGICLEGYHIEEESAGKLKEAYKEYLEAYESFGYQRMCISYPKAKRGKNRIRLFGRNHRLKGIELITSEQYINYPIGLSFTLNEKKPEHKVNFIHPITGKEHQLAFTWQESVEVPIPKAKLGKVYAQMASYQVFQELGLGEQLIFDQAMQFEQVEEQEKAYMPTARGSIGIIGGACGPTAIFIAGKNRTKETQYCYSKLSDQIENCIFYLEGIRILKAKAQSYIFKA